MTDDELDQILAAAASITDDRLDSLPLAEPAVRLREAIVSNHNPIPRPFPRRLAAVAAAVVLFVGIVGVVVAGGGGEERRAWAAELVEFAESSPQLLLSDPAWEVTRADQYGDGEGEMSFAADGREADLHWRAGAFEEWAAERAASASSVTTVEVLGTAAQVSQYEGTDDFTALWPDRDRTIEFRMTAESQGEFVEVLSTLREVDLDAWLTAMPDSVIHRAGRAVAVNEMLADISLPDGFDVAALRSSTELKDRYQLGAEVTGAVGCAWVEQWTRATASGDVEPAQAAVDAMAASHEWAILQEMSDEGAWPQVFWIVADGMASGGVVDGGLTVEEFAPGALGCAPSESGD